MTMFNDINRKITDFFKSWWSNNPRNDEISPQQALEIQKQSYVNEETPPAKSMTPPYLTIAEQLGSEKKQVFEAAVFYLCTIAATEPKYKKPIAYILKSFLQKNHNNAERAGYLSMMIEKYKLSV